MTLLKMVKVWSHEDSTLFLHDAYRFTSAGLTKYWMSIDSAIRYWDMVHAAKMADKLKPYKGKIQNECFS